MIGRSLTDGTAEQGGDSNSCFYGEGGGRRGGKGSRRIKPWLGTPLQSHIQRRYQGETSGRNGHGGSGDGCLLAVISALEPRHSLT